MNYLVDTPNFMKLSKQTTDAIVTHAARQEFNTILKKIAKRGNSSDMVTPDAKLTCC